MQSSSSINLMRRSISSCLASRRLSRPFVHHHQHPPAQGRQLVAPVHLPFAAAASTASSTAAGGKPSGQSPSTEFPGFDPAPPGFEPSSGVDRPPGTPDPGFPVPPPPDAMPPESPPNVLPPEPPEMWPPLWPPEDTPPGFMFS